MSGNQDLEIPTVGGSPSHTSIGSYLTTLPSKALTTTFTYHEASPNVSNFRPQVLPTTTPIEMV